MKVTAFNGSPRKNGNTSILIKKMFEVFNANGIETELINIGSEAIMGCQACGVCKTTQDNKCCRDNDSINKWVEKAKDSDGIILGSPVYFADISGQTKIFIDRVGYVARANNFLFEDKIGMAVTAVRRAGALPTFNTINNFFLVNKMIVPGSSYWNLGIGRNIGEVNSDTEGMENMIDLAERASKLILKFSG